MKTATKTAKVETQAFTRNKLVTTLMKIGHGDLSLYIPDGLAAAKADPELLAHFVAWNKVNGKVRDARVALPAIALRGLGKNDSDLIENALAHMLSLNPRELVRSYNFSKELTAQGFNLPAEIRRSKALENALKLYLEKREASPKWWTKTAVQHRRTLKKLYRLAHKKPSAYAQRILFDNDYPENSVFAKIANMKNMSAAEAAGVILSERLPFEVAVGAVPKAKDKDVVLALLEGMTGNQLITNSQMLEKFGVMKDPILKSAYDAAMIRAKSDKRVEILKAGVASTKVSGAAKAQLSQLQDQKLKQMASIDGDWLILADKSGSMNEAIELARNIAGILASKVSGSVYLVFFDNVPTFYDVTGKTYEEIVNETKRMFASGGTNVACGLDYIASRGILVNGITLVSDGGENSGSFAETYFKYCKKNEIDPPVYFYRTRGDADRVSSNFKARDIQLEVFDMGSKVDYYSLPNLVMTQRASRYALFDDILAQPLLTFKDVFKQKEI